MKTEWFDKKTGIFRLDEIVASRESLKKIMADQVVTDEEIETQSQHVVSLLHKLHDTLSEEQREEVLELLAEMTVLYATQKYQDMQGIWMRQL